MPDIFISYRRADSIYVVSHIYDRLAEVFGDYAVFKDLQNIPAGANFREVIREELESCKVALIAIGPDWLTAANDDGPRLEQLDDPVRAEVELALQNPKVLVIPMLVMGAKMPTRNQLPDVLGDLADLNAVQVRPDPDFDSDMERLVMAIRYAVPAKNNAQPLIADLSASLLGPSIQIAVEPDETRQIVSGKVPLAGILSRFLAGVIDWLILYVPFAIFLVITGGDLAGDPIEWFVFVLLAMLYFIFGDLGAGGRTFGKFLFGIRVVQLNGYRPTLKNAVFRAAVYMVTLWAFALPLLSATFLGNRRGVHDIASGTVVVRSNVNARAQQLLEQLAEFYRDR